MNGLSYQGTLGAPVTANGVHISSNSLSDTFFDLENLSIDGDTQTSVRVDATTHTIGKLGTITFGGNGTYSVAEVGLFAIAPVTGSHTLDITIDHNTFNGQPATRVHAEADNAGVLCLGVTASLVPDRGQRHGHRLHDDRRRPTSAQQLRRHVADRGFPHGNRQRYRHERERRWNCRAWCLRRAAAELSKVSTWREADAPLKTALPIFHTHPASQ